jgi:hypothetical protein
MVQQACQYAGRVILLLLQRDSLEFLVKVARRRKIFNLRNLSSAGPRVAALESTWIVGTVLAARILGRCKIEDLIMRNIDEAIRHPSAVFDHPGDVLRSGLAESTQREILRSWEYSLQQRQIATAENMPGENPNDDQIAEQLQTVHSALEKLGDN